LAVAGAGAAISKQQHDIARAATTTNVTFACADGGVGTLVQMSGTGIGTEITKLAFHSPLWKATPASGFQLTSALELQSHLPRVLQTQAPGVLHLAHGSAAAGSAMHLLFLKNQLPVVF
jgi:hypothetical protein